MLEIEGVHAAYGRIQILWDISLNVKEGELVALVGANGAGKTTLLKTVSGILRPTAGVIRFCGERIDNKDPNAIVEMGLSHIPEGRRLFPDMSVRENLEMGAYTKRAWKKRRETIEEVFQLFPRLKERAGQLVRTLSGGEQQMVAMGRGLMSLPRMCLIDEPSNGLAPLVVAEVFQIVKSLAERGMTILLVEQNVRRTLTVVNRAYVLESGRIALEGPCSELLCSDHVRRAYLGL